MGTDTRAATVDSIETPENLTQQDIQVNSDLLTDPLLNPDYLALNKQRVSNDYKPFFSRLTPDNIHFKDSYQNRFNNQIIKPFLAKFKKDTHCVSPYPTKDTNALRVTDKNFGNCQHCDNEFKKNVTWQKFCREACRIAAYELRTGKKLNLKKTGQGATS